MTNEQVISQFLRPPDQGGAYTDEKLAALLAHAEDGKLGALSCCCLIGIITVAGDALAGEFALQGYAHNEANRAHYRQAKELEGAAQAEMAFIDLAPNNQTRRAALIPLIRAEMARREAERESQTEVTELVTV